MRPNSLIRQMEADAAARQGDTQGNGQSSNGSARAKPKKTAASKK
jgi:hypothetical protein